MTTVFIAGSISIKRLDPLVKDRIETIVASGFEIVVGDAKGVDAAVQGYLKELGAEKVCVFCTGAKPRNNLGDWHTTNVRSAAPKGTREFFTAKDREMTKIADFGLMIWDHKSVGTISNVKRLAERRKKSVVFIQPQHRFVNISDESEAVALCSALDANHAVDAVGGKSETDRKVKAKPQLSFDL